MLKWQFYPHVKKHIITVKLGWLLSFALIYWFHQCDNPGGKKSMWYYHLLCEFNQYDISAEVSSQSKSAKSQLPSPTDSAPFFFCLPIRSRSRRWWTQPSLLLLDLPAVASSDLELSDFRRFNSFELTPPTFSPSLSWLSPLFSTSNSGLWVTGSIPLCLSFFLRHEFHRFFISLSVLPGNCAAIWDHLKIRPSKINPEN